MGNKEVRDILLGRIVRQDEQFWVAAPADAKFHFHGLKDGAGDVRLFGVTHRKRRYQTAEPDTALEAAEEALYSMGRPLQFASMPESKGCLYAPHWIAPVVLAVEQDAGGLEMTAYTGRSLLFGQLRCHIALWILEQRLPEGVTSVGKSKESDRQEAKHEKPAKREQPPKREQAAKREKPARSEGKRAAPLKKKTAAPKRLMK